MFETLNAGDLAHAYERVSDSCAYSTSEYRLTGRGEIEAIDFGFFALLESHWRRLERVIVDANIVVAWVRFGGAARHTGRTFEIEVCNVFKFGGEFIVEWEMFGDFATVRSAVS